MSELSNVHRRARLRELHDEAAGMEAQLRYQLAMDVDARLLQGRLGGRAGIHRPEERGALRRRSPAEGPGKDSDKLVARSNNSDSDGAPAPLIQDRPQLVGVVPVHRPTVVAGRAWWRSRRARGAYSSRGPESARGQADVRATQGLDRDAAVSRATPRAEAGRPVELVVGFHGIAGRPVGQSRPGAGRRPPPDTDDANRAVENITRNRSSLRRRSATPRHWPRDPECWIPMNAKARSRAGETVTARPGRACQGEPSALSLAALEQQTQNRPRTHQGGGRRGFAGRLHFSSDGVAAIHGRRLRDQRRA